jgi:hypothetical protein
MTNTQRIEALKSTIDTAQVQLKELLEPKSEYIHRFVVERDYISKDDHTEHMAELFDEWRDAVNDDYISKEAIQFTIDLAWQGGMDVNVLRAKISKLIE